MAAALAGFEVRPVTAADVSRMAEIDRSAFAGLGMGYYDESYVRCWLEVNPEGLLMAWQGGKAVACCYSQYVDFSPGDESCLTTDAAYTDSAFTRATHRPDGDSIHVVSVSSVVPGGRTALFEVLMRQLVARKRAYLILFSRLAGLRDYSRMLTGQGVDLESVGLGRLARWYVGQCAVGFGDGGNGASEGGVARWGNGQPSGSGDRPSGVGIWPAVAREFRALESLALPAPVGPDPVLNKYLRDRGAAVAAVLTGWIEDPASCNCSALVVNRNPEAVAR